jgi:hypothetical protein
MKLNVMIRLLRLEMISQNQSVRLGGLFGDTSVLQLHDLHDTLLHAGIGEIGVLRGVVRVLVAGILDSGRGTLFFQTKQRNVKHNLRSRI